MVSRSIDAMKNKIRPSTRNEGLENTNNQAYNILQVLNAWKPIVIIIYRRMEKLAKKKKYNLRNNLNLECFQINVLLENT